MKEKLLLHWEKGVVGLVALVMAYFVSSAMSLERFDKTPGDFDRVTQQANDNVRKSEPDLSKLVAPDMDALAANLRAPVDPDPFLNSTRWYRPVDFGGSFRDQPAVLTPPKPTVQSNRGMLALFQTDENGERVMKKVPIEKSVYAQVRNQRGVSSNPDNPQNAQLRRLMEKIMRGEEVKLPSQRRRGGGGGGGIADMDSIDTRMDDMAMDPGMDMGMNDMDMNMGMGGGLSGLMFEGGGGAMQGLGMEIPMAAETQNVISAPEVRERKQRYVLPKEIVSGKGKEEEKKKDTNAEEEQEFVEEPIEQMAGKHWVEIVAPFPHEEQIREYVRKLHEPCNLVGLRYSSVDVQRRDLQSDHSWSDWAPISLKDQWKVILNAISYEPETYPQVTMKGLAMNIPFVQSSYKPFLTLPEFENPEQATYTNDDRFPRSALRRKRVNRRPLSLRSKTEIAKINKSVAAEANPIRLRELKRNVNLRRDPNAKDDPGEAFDNRYLVKHAMIRVWDFTVEPGRRYQYRIRVSAFNPNWNRLDVVEARYAKGAYISSDWSEPSDEVYVRNDVQWYAGNQSTRKNDRATIEVHSWSKEMGEWVTSTFLHHPGDVIGLSSSTKSYDLVNWDEENSKWTMKSKVAKDEFDTSSILLDVSGGSYRGQSRRFEIPKEVVALNAFGDLERRGEMEDQSDPIREAIAGYYKDTLAEFASHFTDIAKTLKKSLDPTRNRGTGGGGGGSGDAGAP